MSIHIPTDKKFWANLAIYAIAGLIIIFFLPHSERVELSYEKNRQWSNPQLLAPFDLPYYLAPELKKERIDSIDKMLVPVYDIDATAQKNLVAMINGLDSVSSHQRDALVRAVEDIYKAGVVSTEDARRIASGELQHIKISTSTSGDGISTSRMRTSRQAYEHLEKQFSRTSPTLWRVLQTKNLSTYLLPNVKENAEKTAELRNSLLTPIEAVQGIIQKGEEIINRGEMVTP